MMIKNKKSKGFALPLVIILIVILNLAFFFFVKYQNQGLSISEYEFSNFGNLLNILLTAILLFGIITVFFKKNLVFEVNKFLFFLVFNQLLLIAIYISKFIFLPFKEIYFSGLTGDELFIGFISGLYTLTYFVMIFIVWLAILKVNKIIIIRSIFNSALSFLMILLVVFLFIVGKESGIDDKSLKAEKINVGVVLGAAVWSGNKASPSLTGRVDKALKLYEQKIISQIYLTGSNAPGELSESEVAFRYIKAKGINTSEVFLEKVTTSTNEQIRYVKNNLIISSNKNVVVISDSYHLVRVLEIAKFHKLKIQVSASELSQSFEKALYNKIREALALTMFWLHAI